VAMVTRKKGAIKKDAMRKIVHIKSEKCKRLEYIKRI
jgi:hypothetical protein